PRPGTFGSKRFSRRGAPVTLVSSSASGPGRRPAGGSGSGGRSSAGRAGGAGGARGGSVGAPPSEAMRRAATASGSARASSSSAGGTLGRSGGGGTRSAKRLGQAPHVGDVHRLHGVGQEDQRGGATRGDRVRRAPGDDECRGGALRLHDRAGRCRRRERAHPDRRLVREPLAHGSPDPAA